MRAREARRSARKHASFAAYSGIAWGVILFLCFPFFWILSTAFKPETELFVIPPTLFPVRPTIDHFAQVLFETPFLVYFRNSAIVALCTTLFSIVVGVLGGYSLARFDYRGVTLISRAILLTYLLPAAVLVIPLYLVLAKLGLVNTLLGLVICYTTFIVPFALWLLRSFIAAIPRDLEAAAMVDGASRIRAFTDIVLPQALPGIIATALFSFILSWNEYLYALVLLNRDDLKTLPPGVLTTLVGGFNIEWGMVMASAVLMSAPIVVVFALLQSYLTQGLGAGAVKG